MLLAPTVRVVPRGNVCTVGYCTSLSALSFLLYSTLPNTSAKRRFSVQVSCWDLQRSDRSLGAHAPSLLPLPCPTRCPKMSEDKKTRHRNVVNRTTVVLLYRQSAEFGFSPFCLLELLSRCRRRLVVWWSGGSRPVSLPFATRPSYPSVSPVRGTRLTVLFT